MIKSHDWLVQLTPTQLNNGSTIKADPFVHVKDLVLLFVEGNVSVLLHVTDGSETILQLV